MAINLKSKPHFRQTSEFHTALVDLDLVAFAVASASDGHFYCVIDPNTNELLVSERYKKDINKWFKENPSIPKAWLQDDYNPEKLDTVLHSAKQMLSSILGDVGAKEYRLFLTGSNNFRYKVNPKYKANRINTRKPYHLKSVREYFVKNWGAEVVDGMEADDALGINQLKPHDVGVQKCTVICSIDKDLLCVPGWHYSWSHHGKQAKLQFVSNEEARLNFYRQVLTGDKTDGIEGIDGIGPVKAKEITDSAKSTTSIDLYKEVLKAYENDGCLVRRGFKSQMNRAKKRVLFVARQIWILQEENKMWEAPK